MTIVDIRKLSSRAVAIIDEHACVTIGAREGATLPLSPQEAREFQAFLATNEPRLIEACGGAPIRERVRVWLPETAKEALDESYNTILWPILRDHPDHAVMYGRIKGESAKGIYLGGFSKDYTLFVLIPYGLVEARSREILLQLCQKEEPGDMYKLALRIEEEERCDDPLADHPSVLAHAARMQALEVAYWLALAGPEPTMHDVRDARHTK